MAEALEKACNRSAVRANLGPADRPGCYPSESLGNIVSAITSTAADRLLGVIKRRGPQGIADIAAVLGITSEAARQQVSRLAANGLLAAETKRREAGRPTRLWYLTAAGHAQFPDTHAELTLRLIDAVRSELGEPALEQLIRARETETLQAYRNVLSGARTLADKLARLAEIRSREGYMAEWCTDAVGFLLLENHCPICAAATACQGFCRSELDVFRAALGPDVTVERTDHILAGARRCTYRIVPVSTRTPETQA
jgi:predicted ArsR family transcriptional regulator